MNFTQLCLQCDLEKLFLPLVSSPENEDNESGFCFHTSSGVVSSPFLLYSSLFTSGAPVGLRSSQHEENKPYSSLASDWR